MGLVALWHVEFSWSRVRAHISCGSCIGRWILNHWATWEAPVLIMEPRSILCFAWLVFIFQQRLLSIFCAVSGAKIKKNLIPLGDVLKVQSQCVYGMGGLSCICTGGAAWRPVTRGPMRVTLCIEIQGELCFPLYICLYCLNFLHKHVLFIEPEIAHRKLFSLKGEKEMKEACSGPGTLWLRRPEPPHWRW